jgi:two-component system CheB/CheR fusion protein
LRRFFVEDDRGYRVSKEIREAVVFAPQNVIMDPPFTKLDILSCRNLLIYLSSELQKKLIPLFHYSLSPGGVLFLGSAETVGAFSNLFVPLDGKARIYRRLETAVGLTAIDFPSSSARTSTDLAGEPSPESFDAMKLKPPTPNLQALADRVIVQRFSPAAVLANEKGDILYIGGRTGKYLEPAAGKVNWNVFAMAREGLRYELSSAFSSALREERPVTARGISVGTNGGTQIVDLTVQQLKEPRELRGTVMVVFTDVALAPGPALSRKAPRGRARERREELEQELQRAREETQTVREEMQTSQEELRSTNEELQSTNEELQSSNEELTTSKEEMQSMNEELQTVNHELQAKVDELSRSSNDMKNLLNSTDIATLFLDGDLRVRRFTTPTAKLIKLIPGDTGRPVTDLVSELEYPGLADDAREVLRTLAFKEKLIGTRDGRWFLVRIMPYRTHENVIDGLVITFNDAASTKLLETTLREQVGQLRQMAESLPNLVWGARPDGSCDYLSRQWAEYTGISEGTQLGDGWLEQVHPDDRERVRDEWKAAVDTGEALDTELRLRSKSGDFRWFKARSAPIRDEHGDVVKWYGTHTDVDDLKHATGRWASILDSFDEPFFALDGDLTVTSFNAAAERALARRREDLLGKRFLDAFPEAAGSVFDDRCREAIRERRAFSFEAPFERAPCEGWYSVRVCPHAHGIFVFFQRKEERLAASRGGGSES